MLFSATKLLETPAQQDLRTLEAPSSRRDYWPHPSFGFSELKTRTTAITMPPSLGINDSSFFLSRV